jgi:hypothetical protein
MRFHDPAPHVRVAADCPERASETHPVLDGHSTIRVTMDMYDHLMRDADNEALEKLAALIGGSKTVVAQDAASQKDTKSLKEMEAGVGIEPAYTALQNGQKKNQDDTS